MSSIITDLGGVPWSSLYLGVGGVRCNETRVPPFGSPKGSVCVEIFVRGLRNPYRISMDPNTKENTCVYIYIGDLGANVWEDYNECDANGAGANYGGVTC